MEKKLIHLERVIDDMYQDKGIVSLMARDYYYENYATEEEKKKMDIEDKIQTIVAWLFILSIPVVGLIGLVVQYFV